MTLTEALQSGPKTTRELMKLIGITSRRYFYEIIAGWPEVEKWQNGNTVYWKLKELHLSRR